jgi:2-desacetyl-2-hydroxyethyl bacteriochlorophyllide A dehydrogenase
MLVSTTPRRISEETPELGLPGGGPERPLDLGVCRHEHRGKADAGWQPPLRSSSPAFAFKGLSAEETTAEAAKSDSVISLAPKTREVKSTSYLGPRRFTTLDAPMPMPGADEALLKIKSVGICGTDLHIFQGHLDHRVPRGGVIGHETFAEVVEAPDGSGFTKSDRVVVEPVRFCGACRACRMGATYLCYRLKVLGVDLPGGMREYWAAPVARLLKIPAEVSDAQAALTEPLAIAVHDVRRAGVQPGDRILVFGGGPIGTLIALVARERGAHVAVAEINPFRLDLLRKYGLEAIGPERDAVRWVEAWTGGTGADVAFEVTGSAAAARVVTDVVRVWGTVSIVAIHAEPVPVNLYRLFARELVVHGARLYARADWEEAIRLLATGAVDVTPLISRRLPLEALQQGMEEALAGGPVMKVLICP